jgi:hypothetical protein
MLHRCEDSQRDAYRSYGGRATPVQVCEGWHDYAAFTDDIEATIGPRPEGRTPKGRPLYTIDRTNNNGHYSCGKCRQCRANGWPFNIRWATWKEQRDNRRPMIGMELAEMPAEDPWTCPWPECDGTGLTERQWDDHLRKTHKTPRPAGRDRKHNTTEGGETA